MTLLLPCAVADGWRVWPLLAIWIGGYAVRRRHEDRQLTTDCAVSGILYAWLARENLIATASKSWNIWMSWIRSAERTSLIYAVSSVALPLTILAFFLWRTFVSSKNTTATPLDISRWRSQIETPKPKIFPCQTYLPETPWLRILVPPVWISHRLKRNEIQRNRVSEWRRSNFG